MSLNSVRLIGHLGRDPELRHTQGGTAVCNLNVATSRRWKDKQTGEWKEEAEWHRVVVFGKQAENCHNYLAKGRQVFVDGRLQTRSYETKSGEKRYSTEVVANEVQFLGGKGGQRSGGSRQREDRREPPEPYDPGGYERQPGDDEDDIPF